MICRKNIFLTFIAKSLWVYIDQIPNLHHLFVAAKPDTAKV